MIYKYIKTRGPEGARTGYFVPCLYSIPFTWSAVRDYGLDYVLDRLNGWSVWWVDSKENLDQAIKTLDELKKTRLFDYIVSR